MIASSYLFLTVITYAVFAHPKQVASRQTSYIPHEPEVKGASFVHSSVSLGPKSTIGTSSVCGADVKGI